MKNYTLVGPGLSGTSHMREILNKTNCKRLLDSYEENAHTRIVPKNHPCNVLFIYADPRDILLCAVNRSAKEIEDLSARNSSDTTWLHGHCKQIEGDCEFVSNIQKISIEYILNTNYDPMQLEEHFMNWLTAEINYKMMMLKYEVLSNPETFQKVLDFFEMEGDYSYKWRQRKTSYLNLPVEQQIQITNLFKNLLKKQAELPSIYIR